MAETQRHEVTLGEMRSRSEDTLSGAPLGEFVISFTVEPPVRFRSEKAAGELGRHVLVAWNALGKQSYAETGTDEEQYRNDNALITFSHESGEGDDAVTRGVVSGSNSAHPDHFEREALQRAFDIVLNGDSPQQ
jgi:hypothetical protein